MKTVLLTFVVVTIVTLDLGYTLQCYHPSLFKKYETCAEGKNFCYSRVDMITPRGAWMEYGCTATCTLKRIRVCCKTDKCNG
uniref:Three-finger toxin n=1 Tax=Calliophis bivirgatus TaxID=8633 RepID=A0A898IPP1_CALBG|nr:three-finger toxin [Calliophis bivirgatus]